MEKKNIIYSTNINFNQTTTLSPESKTSNRQDFRIHLVRLKGGKLVTVLRGYKGNIKMLKSLGSYLKKQCSVGGTTKNGEIIIQGDFRDKVLQLLLEKGHRAKLAGG